MDKAKLVDALKNVDPARSEKLGIAKGFWFTGTRIMAYNSEMALSVPFKTEFQGSIQETILPLLVSSSAETVDFTNAKDDHLIVKAGNSKFKLQTTTSEDLTFKIPKMPEDATFKVKDVPEFLFMLKACTRSLGNDVSEQEFKGITFIAKKGVLHMFGFERITLTHAQVAVKGDMGFTRVLIPTGVVNQLLRITDGATEMQMTIDDKMIMCKANGVTLWGRIEEQERNPIDFLSQISAIKAKSNKMMRIDGGMFERFPGILERACIITQAAVDVTKTRIEWQDGRMYAKSQSSRGVADESASPAKKSGGHPDVVVNVDPERMRRGLDLTKMLMTDAAVIFANDEDTLHYFVSGS